MTPWATLSGGVAAGAGALLVHLSLDGAHGCQTEPGLAFFWITWLPLGVLASVAGVVAGDLGWRSWGCGAWTRCSALLASSTSARASIPTPLVMMQRIWRLGVALASMMALPEQDPVEITGARALLADPDTRAVVARVPTAAGGAERHQAGALRRAWANMRADRSDPRGALDGRHIEYS